MSFCVHHERAAKTDVEENKLLNEVVILVFFVHNMYSRSFINYSWTTDVTWTILTMFSLPFWALSVVVPLLSMEDQKALGFHQKYLKLCSEDERSSYGFGRARVINDRIFIFGWTIYLMILNDNLSLTLFYYFLPNSLTPHTLLLLYILFTTCIHIKIELQDKHKYKWL